MLAISRSPKQAPLKPAGQQDTAKERRYCSGSNEPGPEVTVVSSGIYAMSDAKTGAVVYAGIIAPTFSTLDWHFQRLVEEWRRERGAESSITKIAMCPSYQRILAMGPQIAVPMILRQMESEGDEPDHWFWALGALTGATPVPDDASGDMVQMAQAWLDWGRQRYAW